MKRVRRVGTSVGGSVCDGLRRGVKVERIICGGWELVRRLCVIVSRRALGKVRWCGLWGWDCLSLMGDCSRIGRELENEPFEEQQRSSARSKVSKNIAPCRHP